MNADSFRTDADDVLLAQLRREARAWAIKLKTGQPTTDDVAALRQWVAQSPAHAQAWSAAAHDWKTVDEAARQFESRLHERGASREPSRVSRPSRRWFLGGAATAFGALAVVGIVRPPLGLWPSWSELGADYRTATGEQRDLDLANNLRLTLNTQTSVTVHQVDGVQRIALIAGEAAVMAIHTACEVVADAGRLVLSDADLQVRRLPDGRVRVQCRQGEVVLHHPTGTVSLQGGQQLVYTPGQVSGTTVVPNEQAPWRQGMVVFDDMPLRDVVDEINRYRPGRVVLLNNEVAQRRFSARFKIAALDEAIALLEAVHQIHVRRVGDVVLLS